jgi:beta-lactamase regulating signal transducer with metallopeptidase domain
VTEPLLDTPLVQSIGWALIHFIWQGTAIGLATALALRLLAGARPTMRYAVGCFSLVFMLIVPVVAVLIDRASESVTVASTAAVSVSVVPPVPLDRLLPSAVVIWLAGVLLLSVRLIVACAGVERLKKATRSVDATIVARVQSLAYRFGIDRPLRVFESTLVRVPTVVGCLRPIILLPASVITGLSPAYLDGVLAHELAHVRRHDYLVNVLQSLVETLLFYHPAVWWCSRQIRIEREHCCDDMVVEAVGNRVAYAAALAQLEELRGLQPMLSLNASGGRLVERIRRLLGGSPVKERRSTVWTIAAALAVVTAIVVTPALTVADASELVMSRQSDGGQANPPEVPVPPPAVPDRETLKEADWADYVRETQAALETLARETQGVAVLAEQAEPQPQAQPRPQPQAQPAQQPQPQPTPQPAPRPLKAQPAPQPPLPPVPPAPSAVTLPTAPPSPAPLPPAPPMPPNSQIAVPALPAPPAPPAPPAAPLGLDPDSIHELITSATQQIAESFEELRRATKEVGLKQEAIRQAQAEIAKMRLESLTANAQIDVMQKTLSEFSAKSAASQLDRREIQKLIDELSAELAKLRDR